MRLDIFARMVAELEQLDERIDNLRKYLYPVVRSFGGMQVEMPQPVGDEKCDLLEQQQHMRAYRDVLARRIARHAQEL